MYSHIPYVNNAVSFVDDLSRPKFLHIYIYIFVYTFEIIAYELLC